MSATASPVPPLLTTPLHSLHLELGAKMVPFAGYAMPVNYPQGILAEHRQCRDSAALFDVSHMGQLRLVGDDAARALESLVPVDIVGLGVGRQRYGFFTDASGGLLDDLMITRREDDLLVIVNAACKDADTKHLVTHIGHRCSVVPMPERALVALQGPKAVVALSRLEPAVAKLTFMTGGAFRLHGIDCYLTRSGYTGEDGFEISVPAAQAEALARVLLEQPEVRPAGLGARDTLRLEAGLCLYGHDIHATTTPVEAGLSWAIQKVRRAGGARAGGYPGADVIDGQLATGPSNKRVGLVGLERVPVREGTELVDAHGRRLGHVTSGTLGPTVNQPIAMAYVAANHAAVAHEVYAVVRGKPLPMRVSPLPFAPHRYVRG
ncbi:glycine cleavage system aminomethyltransferase GcvT [uncultured Methylibium sp.]|uniref:glycine cleavage system aminomethyltransferase GcvT n=1 Tax=uncultured Methylibium sp. TaxID=381093 RepID=UPI0025D1B35D|nr:glycine cleavage system aminomethyltransferase GcvT [uncultured Methylibium sp.]